MSVSRQPTVDEVVEFRSAIVAHRTEDIERDIQVQWKRFEHAYESYRLSLMFVIVAARLTLFFEKIDS